MTQLQCASIINRFQLENKRLQTVILKIEQGSGLALLNVRMPAGVSWPLYLRMFGASVLSMFAGAEVVHQYYRPDLTIPEIPPKPGELRTELLGFKSREEAAATAQRQ